MVLVVVSEALAIAQISFGILALLVEVLARSSLGNCSRSLVATRLGLESNVTLSTAMFSESSGPTELVAII